jgi:hypothetical protein
MSTAEDTYGSLGRTTRRNVGIHVMYLGKGKGKGKVI